MPGTFPRAVLALVLLGVAPSGAVAAPARAPSHDPADPSIDCPLHAKGVSPSSLRPFADTERYIEFLERPDRARWQRPEQVVEALGLAGTETLVDVGAGSGYFTFRLARALPKGKVLATDVDPEMVRHIHHRVMTEGIRNVKALLADPRDPGIAPDADLVFVSDVLHHVADRGPWLRKAFSEMKPGARLVVIEFKEGKLPEGPPESVKIPKARLVALVEGAGFELRSDRPDLLPYQTFLTFRKPMPRSAAP